MSSTTTQTDVLEFKIPAKSDYVGVIRLAVSGIASRLQFSIEKIEDIKIALSEACTNVVLYAYSEHEEGFIHVTCTAYSDKLDITIKDTGIGFNTDQVKKEKESTSLGLGLTFIKNLMDSVDIQSELGSGTTITMTKQC